MQHADIAPDRFTYNALLEAHTAAEDLEGVARVYKAMLTRGIRPDICTFVALFQVTAPHQRWLSGHRAAYISTRLFEAMLSSARLWTVIGCYRQPC